MSLLFTAGTEQDFMHTGKLIQAAKHGARGTARTEQHNSRHGRPLPERGQKAFYISIVPHQLRAIPIEGVDRIH